MGSKLEERKKTLNDKGIIGTAKSKVTSMSRRGDLTSLLHLHVWTIAKHWTFQLRLVGYQCLMCLVSGMFLYKYSNFDHAILKILEHICRQKYGRRQVSYWDILKVSVSVSVMRLRGDFRANSCSALICVKVKIVH